MTECVNIKPEWFKRYNVLPDSKAVFLTYCGRNNTGCIMLHMWGQSNDVQASLWGVWVLIKSAIGGVP